MSRGEILNVPASRHRSRVAVVVVLAACLALAACSSSSKTSTPAAGSGATTAAAPTTLHIAFDADMQVPDPDIFYEVEGNEVVTSVYEGLVAYKPELDRVRARARRQLDGLARRQDVHVQAAPEREVPRRHDDELGRGQVDFKRRTEGEPRARVHARRRHVDAHARPADVRRAPRRAGERVPRLPRGAVRTEGREPDDPDRARGQGLRAELAEDHDAGTGPYTISKFDDRLEVRAHRASTATGAPKPYFEKVEISIIPSITTQELEARER